MPHQNNNEEKCQIHRKLEKVCIFRYQVWPMVGKADLWIQTGDRRWSSCQQKWCFMTHVGQHRCGPIRRDEIVRQSTRGLGFPGGSVIKESTCQCRRHEFDPWEDPLEKEMAIHSSILAQEIPWTEEPGRATVQGGHKVSDMTERLKNNRAWGLQGRGLRMLSGLHP